MSHQHRLCSLETASGTWTLYLNRSATSLRAVVVDSARPPHLLWHSRPSSHPRRGRSLTARFAWRGSKVVVRYERPTGKVFVTLSLHVEEEQQRPPDPQTLPAPPPAVLERIATNPILAPSKMHRWESLAVFNTAAIELAGHVHLLYRAIGPDGVSVFGHAASRDGLHIDERSAEPVYEHADTVDAGATVDPGARCAYQSGISHVGCEDPRITRVGDRLYVTYTTFDGVNPPGVAVTSIAVADFLQHRWQWQEPVQISMPRETHKNWVLFPEKIGGRFALLHGISPEIQIAFLDSLDFDDATIVESRYSCSGSGERWDSRVRGVGPPPIRTAAGWLVLYHAMDHRDPGRYKVGAMLLDIGDPSRILARLPHPLLEPDARCENEGIKRGVVYACGAVVIGDRLMVYYGGADTVVCVATIELARLLAQLQPDAPGSVPRSPSGAAGAHPK